MPNDFKVLSISSHLVINFFKRYNEKNKLN